jgi:transposase
MDSNDLLNELLGIEKLQVVRSEFVGEGQINLYVESNLPVASCPECGQISEQVHDLSEVQMIRDLPIAESVIVGGKSQENAGIRSHHIVD